MVNATHGENGLMSPTGPTQLYLGSETIFNAIPNTGYQVFKWTLDGKTVLVNNGDATTNKSYTVSNINSNHSLNVSFVATKGLYAGSENGNVYFSSNNGALWQTMGNPDSSAVHSLFSASNKIYAGTANGSVWSSSDKGMHWTSLGSPDSTSVNGIYLDASGTIYAGTTMGNLYSLSPPGSSWITITGPDSSSVSAVYINHNGVIYLGTHKGNIYYSNNSGSSWTTITGPDSTGIKNIYLSSSGTIYANTENEILYTLTSGSGKSWSNYAQDVNCFYLNSSASTLLAATQYGSLFSLIDGLNLGLIDITPISSIIIQ